MKISGIYKIESKIKPERIYIGSAVNIGNRKNFSIKKNNYRKCKLNDLSRHII